MPSYRHRFTETFRGNAGKADHFAAQVSQEAVVQLWDAMEANLSSELTLDLNRRTPLYVDFTLIDLTLTNER